MFSKTNEQKLGKRVASFCILQMARMSGRTGDGGVVLPAPRSVGRAAPGRGHLGGPPRREGERRKQRNASGLLGQDRDAQGSPQDAAEQRARLLRTCDALRSGPSGHGHAADS